MNQIETQGTVNESAPSPESCFHSHDYLRHNQRRQEHLASLRLPMAGRTVLEVAAGIGDHTSFFLDRGCKVVTTEGRPQNLKILQQRYPNLRVFHLDLENPKGLEGEVFEIVYCYGTLYHLRRPAEALAFMAHHCSQMLLMETCVSYGEEEEMYPVDEPAEHPTQSTIGCGCRPTRLWVYRRLKEFFPFVYVPTTQPNHEEFPIDWSVAHPPQPEPWVLKRAVFIASRERLFHYHLVEELLQKQIRQG